MTIRKTLVSFIASAFLVSSVAAHAQTAAETDPNVAPSTAEEELTLPESNPNRPQVATDPDPDVAPSIAGQDAQLPPSPPKSPQFATDPDPDVAQPDDMIGQ